MVRVLRQSHVRVHVCVCVRVFAVWTRQCVVYVRASGACLSPPPLSSVQTTGGEGELRAAAEACRAA